MYRYLIYIPSPCPLYMYFPYLCTIVKVHGCKVPGCTFEKTNSYFELRRHMAESHSSTSRVRGQGQGGDPETSNTTTINNQVIYATNTSNSSSNSIIDAMNGAPYCQLIIQPAPTNTTTNTDRNTGSNKRSRSKRQISQITASSSSTNSTVPTTKTARYTNNTSSTGGEKGHNSDSFSDNDSNSDDADYNDDDDEDEQEEEEGYISNNNSNKHSSKSNKHSTKNARKVKQTEFICTNQGCGRSFSKVRITTLFIHTYAYYSLSICHLFIRYVYNTIYVYSYVLYVCI